MIDPGLLISLWKWFEFDKTGGKQKTPESLLFLFSPEIVLLLERQKYTQDICKHLRWSKLQQ